MLLMAFENRVYGGIPLCSSGIFDICHCASLADCNKHWDRTAILARSKLIFMAENYVSSSLVFTAAHI